MARLLSALLLLSLSACSTTISPQALRDAELADGRAEHLIQNWQSAVDQVNGFLAVAPDPLLHHYSLALGNDGMVLDLAGETQSFAVKCTPWGSLIESSGFEAQERSWGFVVGSRGDGPEVAANSFFIASTGLERSPKALAGLILHEAVHTWTGLGTVGVFRGMQYYWFSIFHGGSADHPHEMQPYQIETLFYQWHSSQRRL